MLSFPRFCERRRLLALVWLATAGLVGWSSAARADEPSATADGRRVLAIVNAKCVRCHGGDAPKGELDLTSAAGLRKGGESGAAIAAGKPDDSPLLEKVVAGEMPPDEKDPLTEDEIEAVRRWIAGGAPLAADLDAPAEPAPTQLDVQVVLRRRCTMCHGPRVQEAQLDLRTKESLLRGGKSGPAIMLGNPAESLLIQKATAGEMPPAERLVDASVKPIEPAEIELISRWIADGAPETAIDPDIATDSLDPAVSEEDRGFWSFRPPQRPAPPQPQDAARVRNPIDAFVLAKLEEKGLSLSPSADRTTLLRRASFDLTGLPPTPEEVAAFLADESSEAYPRAVDRLLASPRYGERWGRHWLDVAGYSDSEGKREQDLFRPHAWRYRDYVIRSFNADRPYDQFLVQQLAGDELADYEHAAEITPEMYDNLVATGFLRMAPDPTWANITGYVPDRMDVIADEVEVLGSAVLGLSLHCARCHSHKFDPIPQRDYYRLLAVFKGAFDEYDWLRSDIHPGIGPVSYDPSGGRHLPHVTSVERRAWEEHNAGIDRQIAELRGGLAPGAEPDEIKQRIAALEAAHTPEPRVHALWDRGEPSPTFIYRRGDWLNPGRLVGPGVPTVLTDGQTPFRVEPPWPGAQKTGRRLAFARWLVQPDQPLTARVMVNRIWKHHFGAGLVKSLGNFGKAGEPPTHPELLDWLATEFVRQGWSIKAMHKLMLTSATYQQSSAVSPQQLTADPDNALLSRMPLARLDAEQLYDALLVAAGRLDETPGGPADRVEARADGLVMPAGTQRGWRRLIYVEQRRKQLATHLENFDYPQMNPNCVTRKNSTVATQALHLLNNDMVRALAEQFADRILREVGTDPAAQVERVYRVALARGPSEDQRRASLEALGKLAAQWRAGATAADAASDQAATRAALVGLCHVVMNSAAFLYVD